MVLRVVEQGWSVTEAAAAAGVSGRTCSKWVARYRTEGEAGLVDRSSAPKAVANRTDERVIAVIAALRRIRFTGPEIAELLGRPLSTVSGILARIGMGKLGRLGLESAQRYERQRPGELVHIDVKKLGRIERGAGHRVTGKRHYRRTRTDAEGHRRETTGWEYSTSPSTTAPAWPTPKSSQTRGPPPRSAFSSAPRHSSPAMASPTSGC
jgi:transposase IS481 family protein